MTVRNVLCDYIVTIHTGNECSPKERDEVKNALVYRDKSRLDPYLYRAGHRQNYEAKLDTDTKLGVVAE